MSTGFLGPRKQRTRQHVIADLSVHHVERFILEAGHTAQRLGSDYGYDLIMFTYDDQGFAEPEFVLVQFKASETMERRGTDCAFDIDIRDYNLWIVERIPVILILYEASHKRAWWLAIQDYFQNNPGRRPRRGAKTIRVRVPQRQAINRRAIEAIRQLKRQGHRLRIGVEQ